MSDKELCLVIRESTLHEIRNKLQIIATQKFKDEKVEKAVVKGVQEIARLLLSR